MLRLYLRLRRAWDRPLTAYYLIFGGGALITVLGLVMVYSASQITALQLSLPGSYFFRKQALAALIGAGLLVAAMKMPVKLHRALAYPILAGAVFLMILVQVPGIGMAVNGNQNWIALGGSFQIQPSEFGKLALVLWGADLLARKQDKRLLTQWKHMLVPFGAGRLHAARAHHARRRHGYGDHPDGDPVRPAVAGGRAHAAVRRCAVDRRAARFHPHQDQPQPHGQAELHRRHRPGPRRLLLAGGARHLRPGLGRTVRFRARCECGEMGPTPEAHTDFIFAVTGEELGLAGTLSVLALFAAPRLCGYPRGRTHGGPS